ncbi:MAG: hypothetical protein WKF63_03360 [Thermomicrobiales bacterium]
MNMVSIRVSHETHQRLQEIARREHRPMSSIAGEAVRIYEKEQRWRAAEVAMARLRENPDEWKNYQAEAAAWDSTSTDGLDDLPYQHRP